MGVANEYVSYNIGVVGIKCTSHKQIYLKHRAMFDPYLWLSIYGNTVKHNVLKRNFNCRI